LTGNIQKLRKEYLEGTEAEKELLEKRYGKKVMIRIVEEGFSEEWLENHSKKCPSCSTQIQVRDMTHVLKHLL